MWKIATKILSATAVAAFFVPIRALTDDTLPQIEQNFVSRLLLQVPGLAECVTAAKRLNAVLRRKCKVALDKKLEDAAGTALGSFAASLRRDLSAVQAALELPWTTNPAEGQINRLKMLKPALRRCRRRLDR
jgi:transposase